MLGTFKDYRVSVCGYRLLRTELVLGLGFGVSGTVMVRIGVKDRYKRAV